MRERTEDIPLLAEAFFHRIGLKNRKPINGIGNDAMACLMAYPWPGNVRELKSAFEYAFVTCQETMIGPNHLPPGIFKHARTAKPQSGEKALNRHQIKRIELIEALKKTRGNQSKAAELLGVTRVTVWNRMRRFGVQYKKTIETGTMPSADSAGVSDTKRKAVRR